MTEVSNLHPLSSELSGGWRNSRVVEAASVGCLASASGARACLLHEVFAEVGVGAEFVLFGVDAGDGGVVFLGGLLVHFAGGGEALDALAPGGPGVGQRNGALVEFAAELLEAAAGGGDFAAVQIAFGQQFLAGAFQRVGDGQLDGIERS